MAENYVVDDEQPTYCDVQDVARVLNKPATYFNDTNQISSDFVKQHILDSEEIVDNDTQTAYRPRKVVNEYKTVDRNEPYHFQTGYRIKLNYKFIKDLDSDKGDKLEVWNGQEYVDYLTTKTEGRGNDFWLDYESGILYIRGLFLGFREKNVRATYRYGQSRVPANIRKATALQVAIMLLLNEDNSFILNETGESRNMPYNERVSYYKQQYKRIVFNQEQDIFVC